MVTYFVAFVLSLAVGAALTLAVRNRAYRFGWFDRNLSSRNIHQRPIPRLGGIAIVLGTFAPLTALLVVHSGVGVFYRETPALIIVLFGGGAVVGLLGLYDDLRGAGARLKLAVQTAVALGLYELGFKVTHIANPFGAVLPLGHLALPFTVLWIVGVINAMNLIDGLDGLAGGVAFFGIATNFILAAWRGDILMCLIMAALGGAVVGFLLFNFNPASIFMGDTGSMFLGYVLAASSLKVNVKSGTAVAMLVPLIALGLPITDTLLAMGRRALVGRPMFSADKEHIHHRIMQRFLMSQRGAVVFLYGICCLFALTALALSFANSAQTAMLLVAVSLVVFVLMRKLGYLTLNPRQVGAARRHNLALKQIVRRMTGAFSDAVDVDDLWDALRSLPEQVRASRLELRVRWTRAGRPEELVFHVDGPAPGKAYPLGARAEVSHRDRPFGSLTLVWRDGRVEIDRDEELALELIADSLGANLSRLQDRPAATPGKVVALRK